MKHKSKDSKLFDGILIFTQVVKCGSFYKAAEVTGHSNSYISKTVNKLEERLAVRLLNRTTRSLSLTPEGKLFFEQCLQLVSDAEDALGLLSQSHVQPKGVLKISCPVAFAQGYLQDFLSKYLQCYPEVELQLDLNDGRVDLIQGGFDLVIRATDQLEESSLICRKIYSCNSYTVASHDYLQRFGRPTMPLELTEHQCLCYSNLKTPTRWHYIDKHGHDIHVDVPAKLLCNSAQMELAMVKAGHGICRLPEFTMEQEINNQSLEILFSDYPPPIVSVYAIYPSRKHLSPKVRCFIDLLVEHMPMS